MPKKSTTEDTEFTETCCFLSVSSVLSVVFNLLPHLIISFKRRMSKIQPVPRHHNSIWIDIHSHCAPSQKLALHSSSA